MKAWQALFGALMVLSVAYCIHINGEFSINTGLADVAPSIAETEQSQYAIDSLRTDIEKRILLLVSGNDDDQVYDALDDLTAGLNKIHSLKLLPSSADLLDRITHTLKPYRFGLLDEAQRQRLASTPKEKLIADTKRDVYSASSVQVYPFDQDPFGFSNASLLGTLQQFQEVDSEVQISHQSVTLLIQGDALNMRQQQSLNTQLDTLIESIKARHGVAIDRSGVFFFASRAAQESKKDISLISTISTIGVVLLLLFVFRSVYALILPVISILLGVGFAFVATHFVFGHVHVLTIVFGASLIGIVIDYSLHYFYHLAQPLSHESVDAELGGDETSALYRALLLSLCTSLIGYAALSFSGLDALKKVALFSCCGLIMAWLSVVCLGPLATRKGLKTQSVVLGMWVNSLMKFMRILPKSSLVIVASVALLLASATWWLAKPVSDDPRVFFNAPADLLASERRVAEFANDYEPGRYILLIGDSVKQIQQRFEAMQTALIEKTDLPVQAFSSVFGLVPSQAKQSESYRLQSKLYGEAGAIVDLAQELGAGVEFAQRVQAEYEAAASQFLSPQEISEVMGDALPPMWFIDRSDDLAPQYVSFVLVKKGINADALSQALAGYEGVEYVNTLAKTKTSLTAQRESASILLMLAYFLVTLLLMLRFRSVRASKMVLVPLFSSAMLILLAFPFGYQLNLFHVMSLFLVLGFGMDYTIFVREMRDHQSKTLQAITLSALTSLLSFGLLALSSIPVVASFGIALLIGNSFNLLGVFVYSWSIEPPVHSGNS